MSIVGESFKDYVKAQIGLRQALNGKKLRTDSDLNMLNNNNAWLKLASSVRVISQTDAEKKNGISGSIAQLDIVDNLYKETEENISTGERRLRDIGLDNTGKFTGNQLARKAVLFNTLTQVNPAKYNDKREKTSEGSRVIRKGVIDYQSNSLWNNNSYGLGSKEQGIVPSPGLISAKINCKNRGSIREATIVMKAYNLFQFELIELLYMRLGFTMMLEWGTDKFINKKGKPQSIGNTIIEDLWFQDFPGGNYSTMLDSIEKYRETYEANYDGFLGKVVNFDWNFQPDGTYDITLKLITVGDVIESLKVNLPAKLITDEDLISTIELTKSTSDLQEINSPIITNAGTSTLSVDLFKDIAKKPKDIWTKEKSNYFGLFDNLEGDYKIKTDEEIEGLPSNLIYPPTGVNSTKFNYFLTFRELITKLKTLVVPSINGGPIIKFSNSPDEEICSCYPNQISFDPRICLIKPQFDEKINIANQEEFQYYATGVKNFYGAFAKLKPFLPEEDCAEPKILYGNIMNIYLNYDFVSTVLEKNTKDGDLSIFRFLQAICNGVNSALGGLNKLEPIIEDDNIIKIIDQNPIPGIEKAPKFQSRFNMDFPFEVYGYSNGPSGSSISNFVRDFSFKTKIGPELASMITIGATAANTSTKNYDGTAFSKWNDGLEDAYALEYKDPKEEILESPEENFPFTNSQLIKIKNTFKKARIDEYIFNDSVDKAADEFFGSLGVFKRSQPETSYGDPKITLKGRRDIELCPITKKGYQNITWEDYARKVEDYLMEPYNKTPEDKNEQEATNYVSWLLQAFGGKLSGSEKDFKLYFYLNSDFYKIGKSLFKAFITQANNINYRKNRKPSNTIGFIPADLGLTIDGLSGVKIYNALTINQRFLPKAYPDSLKFLITKVDHDISDNNWSTSLGTLSVPKTSPLNIDLYSNLSEVIDNQLFEAIRTDRTITKQKTPPSELIKAMQDYNISTDLERAHFLAQTAHESGNFYYKEEIADGSAYEGRTDLGNTQPGDGVKFKGRGLIQLTGRKNYKAYNDYLKGRGITDDILSNPELVATKYYADSAAYWWKSIGKVSGLANDGSSDRDVRRVTKRVNGGFNGIEDRLTKFDYYWSEIEKNNQAFL